MFFNHLGMSFKKVLGCKMKRLCCVCDRRDFCIAAYWDGLIKVVNKDDNSVEHIYRDIDDLN